MSLIVFLVPRPIYMMSYCVILAESQPIGDHTKYSVICGPAVPSSRLLWGAERNCQVYIWQNTTIFFETNLHPRTAKTTTPADNPKKYTIWHFSVHDLHPHSHPQAEDHAEEDRQRKASVEARNRADQTVHEARKALAETYADRVPADLTAALEDSLRRLEAALADESARAQDLEGPLAHVQRAMAECSTFLYQRPESSGP